MSEQGIEVIRYGEMPMRSIKCRNCNSVLGFKSGQEYKTFNNGKIEFRSITCPVCGDNVITRHRFLFWELDFRKKVCTNKKLILLRKN